jgi:hypothetical protein
MDERQIKIAVLLAHPACPLPVELARLVVDAFRPILFPKFKVGNIVKRVSCKQIPWIVREIHVRPTCHIHRDKCFMYEIEAYDARSRVHEYDIIADATLPRAVFERMHGLASQLTRIITENTNIPHLNA